MISTNKDSNVNMEEHNLSTVVKLQEALAEALRIKDELKLQLKAFKAPKESATERCLFLEMIPIEIRNQIYGLLLTNDSLSSLEAVIKTLPNRPHIDKFRLSPAILTTCRQIHSEAASILYDSNTFILDCRNPYHCYTPMWRLQMESGRESGSYSRGVPKKYGLPAIAKVKHWKVIISASDRYVSRCPNSEFLYFCRALSIAPPQSLKVLIVPQGDIFDHVIHPTQEQQAAASIAFPPPLSLPVQCFHYHDMAKVLEPLSFLRGLTLLEIDEAQGCDLPIYDPNPDMSLTKSNDLPLNLKAAIIATAQGTEPLERVFQMFENLLTYAKTFERNDDFKREMEPPYGTASGRGLSSTLHISWAYHSRGYEKLNKNPFKCNPHQHPVELALEEASIASENNDAERFKNARAAILEYLEPQYRRITEAAASAVEFVKYQKVFTRLFCTWNTSAPLCRVLDDEPVNNYNACFDGILLLEKYEMSFRRDMPLETQREIRKRRRNFELAYTKLPRENFMRLASNELEIYEPHSQTHLENFKSYFRSAMDDMDQQYLEIRAARKALFEHDTANWGYELDLETWRCDEMVDWSVNEPKIGPTKVENLPRVDGGPNNPIFI